MKAFGVCGKWEMLKMDAITAAQVEQGRLGHLRLKIHCKIQRTPLTQISYSIAIRMQRNILKGHLFVVTKV